MPMEVQAEAVPLTAQGALSLALPPPMAALPPPVPLAQPQPVPVSQAEDELLGLVFDDFAYYDYDVDGTLSYNEMFTWFRDNGIYDRPVIDTLFYNFNVNRDTGLDVSEFEDFMRALLAA